jgi:hypothetical protein
VFKSVVAESQAGKIVTTETDDIVGIRHQATTDEDTTDWADLVRAVMNCKMCEAVVAL